MKKLIHKFAGIFLLIISTAFFQNASAQVTHLESFDSPQFLPLGWTAVGTLNGWSRRTTGTNPTCTTHTGAGMARFSRNQNANTSQIFASPQIDFTNRGVDTPRVSYWIYRDDGFPTIADIITIYVNTTPDLTGATSLGTVFRSRTLGPVADTVPTNGWYQYTYDIPAGFNSNTNYILVRGANDATQGNNIFIDDIQYVAYPVPCSGRPNAGTIHANDSVICGGIGATTLSLTGHSTEAGVNYQWKSSTSSTGPWTNFGTGNTVETTGPIAATTFYYVVVTCTNSALSDSTPVVHVNVSPNAPPVVNLYASNNGNYCAGIPDTLIATGATFYSWSPAAGLDTTKGDTVYVSLTGAPGSFTNYTVTGYDATGCIATNNVTVRSHSTTIPLIIASPNDTICSGQQLLLRVVPSPGSTAGLSGFLWTTGETNDTLFRYPTVDSIYIVNVVNQFGCASADSIQIRVVTGSVPVITSLTRSNALYCIGGDSVTLAVTGTGATSITWAPANGGLSSLSGNTVHAAPPGTMTGTLYTVTLTSSSGCSASDTIRVRGTNPPFIFNIQSTPANDTICIGDTATLQVQVVGGGGPVTYLWTPGTIADTMQTFLVHPTNNATYYIEVTRVSNGCKTNDSIDIATINCQVGVTELTTPDEIFISPNPTNGFTSIQFRTYQSDVILKVLNSLGQVVTEQIIVSKGNDLYKGEIDLSHLSPGIYLVNIKSDLKNITRKLIKE